MQIFYLFHFYTMDRTQINVALSVSKNWGGLLSSSGAPSHIHQTESTQKVVL